MSGLPATSNQGIAYATLGSWSGTLDGWSSPGAGLVVNSGDIILVQASFTASGSGTGFSWSIQAPTGAVSMYEGASVTDAISLVSSQVPTWIPSVVQSRAALFQAVGPGSASFNLQFQQSSASQCAIANLVIIARIIVQGSPS